MKAINPESMYPEDFAAIYELAKSPAGKSFSKFLNHVNFSLNVESNKDIQNIYGITDVVAGTYFIKGMAAMMEYMHNKYDTVYRQEESRRNPKNTKQKLSRKITRTM